MRAASNGRRGGTRRQQASEQASLIDQMCRDSGLTLSALAAKAGIPNTTLTRYRQLGRPNKLETLRKLIAAHMEDMSDRGLVVSEKVLRYSSGNSLADNLMMPDPTPDRLKLAIATANEDFALGLSDSDVEDLCDYAVDLYRVIVSEENRLGSTISNDPAGRAVARRELARLRRAGSIRP